MKFKAGDEVFIKAEITDVSGYECSERPYFVAPDIYSVNWVSEDKIIPMDKTYTQGLADAWELARKVYALELDEREKILGYQGLKPILEDLTPEYVADAIEAYEKEKAEIKVGDVVNNGNLNGVVTKVGIECVYVTYEDGVNGWAKKSYCAKTGKHIDIESLLRQIGE